MGGCTSSPNPRPSEGGRASSGGGALNATSGAAESWNGQLHSTRSWRTTPSVTQPQLERLRDEFWDSRVQGNREMWAAMRTSVDAAREGRDGRQVAAEFLKAAGLVPANAKRPCLDRCYDESGVLYVVPCYVMRDPANLGDEPVCTEFKDAASVVQDLGDVDETAAFEEPARRSRAR